MYTAAGAQLCYRHTTRTVAAANCAREKPDGGATGRDARAFFAFPPPTRSAAATSRLRLSAAVAAVGQHRQEFSVREYTPVDNIDLCVRTHYVFGERACRGVYTYLIPIITVYPFTRPPPVVPVVVIPS